MPAPVEASAYPRRLSLPKAENAYIAGPPAPSGRSAVW